VVEHPRRDGAVELAVGELELLHVADAGVEAAPAGELDHARRAVDCDHVCAELVPDSC
jgi:hypothetical protein